MTLMEYSSFVSSVLEPVRMQRMKLIAEPNSELEPERPSHFECIESAVNFIERYQQIGDLIGSKNDINLDPSQKQAVVSALTQELSLIQGPPGTGKSFCGGLIAKILNKYTKETILCICYTNHALDQFLNEIVSLGIPKSDILRVGSAGKVSPSLKECVLTDISRDLQFPKGTGRAFFELKNKLSDLEDSMNSNRMKVNMCWTNNSWNFFRNFFKQCFLDSYVEQFQCGLDGQEIFGRGGKMKDDDMWKLWIKGEAKPTYLTNPGVDYSLWNLTAKDRLATVTDWRIEMAESYMDEFRFSLEKAQRVKDQMNELDRSKRTDLLSCRRIIACTTSGASKYFSDLEVAKPAIVMLEEAGEVMEAHVVASLSENCKHLIMIGDHKQLRPKANMFQLTVESGRGFDLNMSMFERLVKSNYPRSVLQKQHRMRPEFSKIIRTLTYPDYLDAPKVLTYTSIRGVQSNLIFVDHDHAENQDPTTKKSLDDGLSKTNLYEVKMALEIIAYLLKQGYRPSQIVILTPYLAQLKLIRQKISSVLKFSTQLSDRDIQDLIDAGLEDAVEEATAENNSTESVRVSTIDNFQGEESDIIVASLVRSNSKGSIGFLQEEQRVNVLLSRARKGMILLGNKETLVNSKSSKGRELWSKIFGLIVESGSLCKGFPTKCERHGTLNVLKASEDFKKNVPEGGCGEPCQVVMKCGHKCPKKCHMFDDHDSIRCTKSVTIQCQKGHNLERQCWDKEIPPCKTCKRADELKRKKEKEAKELEEANDRKASAVAEIDILKDKLADKEKSVKVTLEAKQLELEREILEVHTNEKLKEMDNKLADQLLELTLQPVQKQSTDVDSSDDENSDGYCDVLPSSTDFVASNIVEFPRLEIEENIEQFEVDWWAPNSKWSTILIKHSTAIRSELDSDLKFGLDLMKEGKWVDALKFFNKLPQESRRSVVKLKQVCRSYLKEKRVVDEFLADDSCIDVCDVYGNALIYERLSQMTKDAKIEIEYKKMSFALCMWLRRLEFEGNSVRADWKTNATNMILDLAIPLKKHFDDLKGSGSLKKTPEQKWKQEKLQGALNRGMDELMKMSGLEDVKETFLSIYYELNLASAQGRSIRQKRLNILFCGNPGTGKTTVARCYSNFLKDLGALAEGNFQETSGGKLVEEGVKGLKQILSDLGEGGVLFVDEAYQLDPTKESEGRKVLNELLLVMENNIGKLAVVFAGYKSRIEKLLEFNEGLPSRFPYKLVFRDYTDIQMVDMFVKYLKSRFQSKPLQVEGGFKGKYVRIKIRRIGRLRGTDGFGNARAVLNILDRILEQQATRVQSERENGQNPDIFYISKEDLIGSDPVDVLTKSNAWQTLKDMIGLESVKSSILNLVELIKTNFQLELQEKPILDVSLNRVFIGNPGTGKTSVAKLYGQILCELGLLSNGEVIIKRSADFVGSHVGQSEKSTQNILNATKGKVLVIDEAYGLYDEHDPYRKNIIDTLVADIQNVPGDDQCVLMLGYKDKMEEMMQKSNPGLARRFAMDDAFEFEDYSSSQLLEIFNLMVSQKQIDIGSDTLMTVADVLERQRCRPNFGNGGSVANLINIAVQRMQDRLKFLSAADRALSSELMSVDIDPNYKNSGAGDLDLDKIFYGMVGCDNIKTKFKSYQSQVKLTLSMGRNPIENLPMTFCFVGPPGTGKTTLARKVGEFYHELGVLSSNDVVETSASDFIGQYVGQTAPKAKAKMREGLGRVLFIDEAYRLNPNMNGGSFAQEALDEIVDLLTKKEFHQKLVVILAGYAKDVDMLLNTNPGLSSRFSERIEFESFTASRCVLLLNESLKKEGFVAENGFDMQMEDVFRKLIASANWGNGRDVKTIAKSVVRKVSESDLASTVVAGQPFTVPMKIIFQVLQEVFNQRDGQSHLPPLLRKKRPDCLFADPLNRDPTLLSTTTDFNLSEQDEPPKVPPVNVSDGRDEGVSDAVWNELKKKKKEQKERELELERREEEMKLLEKEVAQRQWELELAENYAKLKDEEDEFVLRVARMKEKIRKEKEEKERKRRELEELQRKAKIEAERRKKLKVSGKCCMGFAWIEIENGFRCAGGSHYMSNSDIDQL